MKFRKYPFLDAVGTYINYVDVSGRILVYGNMGRADLTFINQFSIAILLVVHLRYS